MAKITSYIVKPGDNLSKIANANGMDPSDLIAANSNIKNPNLILVGQEIKIPEKSNSDNSSTGSSHVEEYNVHEPFKTEQDAIKDAQKRYQEAQAAKAEELRIEQEKLAEAQRQKNEAAAIAAAHAEAASMKVPSTAEYKNKLQEIFAKLGGKNYAGGNGEVGKCGLLARTILEKMGLVIPDATKSHGIGYAKNLDKGGKCLQGYETVGRAVNGNASQVFDELAKGGKFEALAISFNSSGHYRHSGEYGHVIVVTGYDPATKKVYLIDNYDLKWKKGTAKLEYNLATFKEQYFGGGNVVNYMTAIVAKQPEPTVQKTYTTEQDAIAKAQQAAVNSRSAENITAGRVIDIKIPENIINNQASSSGNASSKTYTTEQDAIKKAQQNAIEANKERHAELEARAAKQAEDNAKAASLKREMESVNKEREQVKEATSAAASSAYTEANNVNIAKGTITGLISPGTTEVPYSAKSYSLSDEEYRQLVACVYAEASEDDEYIVSDTMGVTSTILNRLESSQYPSDVIGVMSQKGQFDGYGQKNDKFKNAMAGTAKIKSEMIDTINRVLAGERNTPGYSFRGVPVKKGEPRHSRFF